MANSNKLYFEIPDSSDCRTMLVVDASTYVGTPEGATLQIMLPDREIVRELTFNTGSVNVLNSNSLGYTNVTDADDLTPLPDGAYTIKISVCPYDSNWYERDVYRICKLKCQYNKALLALDLSRCDSCFSKEKLSKLTTARVYIEGVVANTEIGDLNKATELYQVAWKILTDLVECDC